MRFFLVNRDVSSIWAKLQAYMQISRFKVLCDKHHFVKNGKHKTLVPSWFGLPTEDSFTWCSFTILGAGEHVSTTTYRCTTFPAILESCRSMTIYDEREYLQLHIPEDSHLQLETAFIFQTPRRALIFNTDRRRDSLTSTEKLSNRQGDEQSVTKEKLRDEAVDETGDLPHRGSHVCRNCTFIKLDVC